MESNIGGHKKDADRKYNGRQETHKIPNWQDIVQVKLAHNISGVFGSLSWRVTLENKIHIGGTKGENEVSSCQMGEYEVWQVKINSIKSKHKNMTKM